MSSLRQLGLVRILFFSCQFLFMARGPFFSMWSEVPVALWYPNGLMSLIADPALVQSYLPTLVTFWKVSFLFVILGLGYKYVAPLNVLAGFFIVNFSHSFGSQIHIYLPIVLASLPLAFSPAGAKYSLDSLILKNRMATPNEKAVKLTLFNMRLVFCVVYFSAGLSKILRGGLSWVTGDSLRNYLISAPLNYPEGYHIGKELAWNIALYDWPILCRVLAGLTLILELSAPLALLGRGYSVVIITCLMIFQISIYLTVLVNFISYLPLYVVWIPVFYSYFKDWRHRRARS